MRPSKLRYVYARNALVLAALGLLAFSAGVLCLPFKSYWTALFFFAASLLFYRLAKNTLNKLRVTEVLRKLGK